MNSKTILITGGTGSLGTRLAERFLKDKEFSKIVIYSRDEYKQSLMKQSFDRKYGELTSRLRFFIGDVRDLERLKLAFKNINYVIHAAALKQVTACEYNPFEAIKTNIIGAQNVISAALEQQVEKVVALSTDKAVNPINLYGGTKLVSDKLFVSANAYSGSYGTRFSVVRYGNVAGSRGSVIPFFKEIHKNGETEFPITNFHMTRFWIELDQGIELVIKALRESIGGETYISKIPSFNVVDLAKALTEKASLREIGIREGEKLHEIMVSKDDSKNTYEYDEHYIIYPHFDWWNSQSIISGRLVKEDFDYRSDNNIEFLNVAEIKARLSMLDIYE